MFLQLRIFLLLFIDLSKYEIRTAKPELFLRYQLFKLFIINVFPQSIDAVPGVIRNKLYSIITSLATSAEEIPRENFIMDWLAFLEYYFCDSSISTNITNNNKHKRHIIPFCIWSNFRVPILLTMLLNYTMYCVYSVLSTIVISKTNLTESKSVGIKRQGSWYPWLTGHMCHKNTGCSIVLAVL